MKPRLLAHRAMLATAILLAGILLAVAARSQGEKDIEMNSVLMETTFKLEGRASQGQTTGTAFIISRPYPNEPNRGRPVLVTAAHVLDEMQGDSAVLHLRRKTDTQTWTKLPIPVPIRANGRPLWTKHPDADIAVMYVKIPNLSLLLLPPHFLADDADLSKFEIHPGDEFKCLGYPLGFEANAAGFPILRSGKIASYPLLPTKAIKTFLLDFRVFKGYSGGPVYFVEANRTYQGSAKLGENIHFIAGLISKEALFAQPIVTPYSEEVRQLQLGLAEVVHASLIREAVAMLPPPETLPD